MKTRAFVLALCASALSLLGQLASASAAMIISDDFEPGIDPAQWAAFGGTVLATNFGGSVSGANSLWFGGWDTRSATTRALDTRGGGRIEFYLRFADGTDTTRWYRVRLPEEAVVLEYSIDGGANWASLASYDSWNFVLWSWQTIAIPSAAQSPNTRFRWRQLLPGGNWALDDVLITLGEALPLITQQPTYQVVYPGEMAGRTVSSSPMLRELPSAAMQC